MVAEILESFKTDDFSSQLDSIKKELESLTQLNPSDQLILHIKEKTRELEQLFKNIDEAEDNILVQRLKKTRSIINNIINEIHDHPVDNALKENMCQNLEVFNNYFGARIVIIEAKEIIRKTLQSEDTLEQYVITNKLFESLTGLINSYWNVFDDYLRQLMTSFAHEALTLITDKHLYEYKVVFRTSDGDDILASFRKTLKEFIEAVLKAQEQTVNKLLDKQEKGKLFSNSSFQKTEEKPSPASRFSCKDIYNQALESAQSPENQKLINTLDSWSEEYEEKLNEISQP